MRHRRLPRMDLPNHTYFLVCCLEHRRPLFENGRLAELLIDLYVEARERGDIKLHGYVVMPDHYHVVVTLLGGASASNVVRRVHSAFARVARKDLHISDRVWQRRFWDHGLREDEDWRQVLQYVHANPVRRGLADDPTDYPWSSCQFWETGEGPVACDPLWW